ncbi:MAG: FG-GAP repeat domain-containing protein, partial [Flavobacteriales bacterium]
MEFVNCITVVDLNGDTLSDILAASESGKLQWWENTKTDDFNLGGTITSNFGNIKGLEVSDLEGDGDNDVIASSFNKNECRAWIKDSTGNFVNSTALTSSIDEPTGLDVKDIDGDNDKDIIIASYRSGVFWLEDTVDNGVSNSYDHHMLNSYNGVTDVKTAHLNEDNELDIVFVSKKEDLLIRGLNDGNQNFVNDTIDEGFENAENVELVDIDQDDTLDIISTSPTNDEVKWWKFQNGDYTPHLISGSLQGAYYADAKDMNGNGLMDIVATSSAGDEIVIYENNGNEQFINKRTILDNIETPLETAFIDASSDPDPDLATFSFYDSTLKVLENTACDSLESKLYVNNGDDTMEMCKGDTGILMTANSPYKYNWILNNSSISNSSYIFAEDSGEYSVEIKNSYGCSDTSQKDTLIIHSVPQQPSINEMGDTLQSSINSEKYKWFLNDTLWRNADSFQTV